MRVQGKQLIGNNIDTSDFTVVNIHPTTFYRRYNILKNSLDDINGLYFENDTGTSVKLYFTDIGDAIKFRSDNGEII